MGSTILIVDDESIINLNTKSILEKSGYRSESVTSGENCIKLLDKGFQPDLIVMDIDLGRGKMDGTETARRLLQRYDIPIVFFSGHTDRDTIAKTEEITNYGYIHKTSGNTEFLLATIKMAIRLHSAEKELVEANDFLSAIFNSFEDGISVNDTELYVKRVNRNIAGHFIKSASFEGKHCFNLYYNRSAPCENCPALLAFQSGNTESAVIVGNENSRLEYIETYAFPLRDMSTGRVTGVVEHMRNVSESVKQKTELDRLSRENENLRIVTLALTSTTDRDKIIDIIFEQSKQIIAFTAVNVCLFEDKKLKIVRHQGYEKYGVAQAYMESVFNVGDLKNIQSIMNSREPVLIVDTQHDPNWVDFEQTAWVRSFLSMPLMLQNTIIGMINFDSDQVNFFSPDDIKRLEPYVYSCAVALEKSFLFTNQKKELERKISAENELRKSLEENRILLREMNHRIRNNLANISSLISIERSNSKKSKDEALRDLLARIEAINLVHDKLNFTGDLLTINIEPYILELCDTILSLNSSEYQANIQYSIEPLMLPTKFVTLLGYISAELLINTMKHTSVHSETDVDVNIRRMGNDIIYRYRDSQARLPKNITHISELRDGTGLKLISEMVSSEGGDFSIIYDGSGIEFKIIFKEFHDYFK